MMHSSALSGQVSGTSDEFCMRRSVSGIVQFFWNTIALKSSNVMYWTGLPSGFVYVKYVILSLPNHSDFRV